jgi:UDP-N-acetylglucosamine 4,6-dehydratase
MNMLNGKDILVTGGTGSFGKKFFEIVLTRFSPRRLIIFSRDELKQHEMRANGFNQECMRYFIGDVRDKERLRRAMNDVDIVIHAAALKQVPSCEYNPFEAVKTNIYGAQNIIDAAIDAGVKQVLALSTDKAVNPVNLYGATKLCAEKIFIQGNAYSKPEGPYFSCVRYGNVIGSRGSVIPLFLEQKNGGIITVTDARMTRFWLTLEEAVELVLKGLKHMQGGEVFVPKLPSMKIRDLAKAIAPGCSIETIGIRPGEKLHEVLLTSEEGRHTLDYKDMYIILPEHPGWKLQNNNDCVALPDNFQYCSNTNDHWLTVSDLRRIVLQSIPWQNEKQYADVVASIPTTSQRELHR